MKLIAECCRLIIKYCECGISMHLQFSQAMPMREGEQEVEDFAVVRFWYQALEYRDRTLPKRLASHSLISQVAYL